jgi:hypothetical protein
MIETPSLHMQNSSMMANIDCFAIGFKLHDGIEIGNFSWSIFLRVTVRLLPVIFS